MVSALDSGSRSTGSSPGRGHGVVFWEDTLLSGGRRNTPSRFMLQKLG